MMKTVLHYAIDIYVLARLDSILKNFVAHHCIYFADMAVALVTLTKAKTNINKVAHL